MAPPHQSERVAADSEDLPTSRSRPGRSAVSKKPAQEKDAAARTPQHGGKRSNSRKAKGKENISLNSIADEESQPEFTPRTSFNSFTCFPKLPLEIQRHIWALAAAVVPAHSPRIFRIAPDPKVWFARLGNYRLDRISSEDARLRIIPDKNSSTPSLLTVCRDARSAARKEYLVWPLANPKSFGPSRGAAYINKTYDTVYFYFGHTPDDEFWFLDLLRDSPDDTENIERDAAALRVYLDQFSGVENVAVHWSQWLDLIHRNHNIEWLLHLSSLRMLTVILDSGATLLLPKETPLCFEPTKPSTPRDDTAKRLIWWTRKCVELLSSKHPEHPIPQFVVRQISWPQNTDDSSRWSPDVSYLQGEDHANRQKHALQREECALQRDLDDHIRILAERAFGMMPDLSLL